MNEDLKDSFRQFARNERWGDCASCPRDSEGHSYPEFCQHSGREDHQLGIDGLVQQYKIEKEESKKE